MFDRKLEDSMKEVIRKIVPKKLLNAVLTMRYRIRLFEIYRSDYKRYVNAAYGNPSNTSLENLRGKITLFYHALEKGLSHENTRFGFGKLALSGLFQSLEMYVEKGYPTQDSRFIAGLSSLDEYIKLHDRNAFPIPEVKERFSALMKKRDVSINMIERCGGALSLDKESVFQSKDTDFVSLINSRYSVRNFSKQKLEIGVLEKAIYISLKSPSACNRQPWKVHIVREEELVNRVLDVQDGMKGFGENLDSLLLVTVDASYYGSYVERNAGYIDGGMYGMTLVYALHHLGVASCILNASFSEKKDKEIRRLVGLSDTELIILLISVGNYPETFNVPLSKRDSIDDIIEYASKVD